MYYFIIYTYERILRGIFITDVYQAYVCRVGKIIELAVHGNLQNDINRGSLYE